jgi:uncharacterized protein DUF4160
MTTHWFRVKLGHTDRITCKRLSLYHFQQRSFTPHVHAKQAEGGAKINLEPIEIMEHFKFSQRQLREIEENQDFLLEKWRQIQGGEE